MTNWNFIDLTGQVFDRLTVKKLWERTENDLRKDRSSQWICQWLMKYLSLGATPEKAVAIVKGQMAERRY